MMTGTTGSRFKFLAVAIMGLLSFLQMNLAANSQDRSGQEMLRVPGASVYEPGGSGVFFAEWLPPDLDLQAPGSVPVLVTLPGSHGLALAELRDWYPYGLRRRFAILALQWWLGGDDYLSPKQVYRLIDDRLVQLHRLHPAIALSGNLLHGFSRGATYMPAAALLDKQSRANHFRMFVLNSGAWPPDNPPRYMSELFDPRDRQAYAGQHFIAYYGLQDEEWGDKPSIHGRIIKDTIEQHGGVFDCFFVLPEGKHGTFVRTPALLNETLDTWRQKR